MNQDQSPEAETRTFDAPSETASLNETVVEAPARAADSADPANSFVYLADAPDPRPYAEDPALAALAELLAHPQAQTPISAGLLGPAGSGKTSALECLSDGAAQRARARGLRLLAVNVDSGLAGDEPEVLVAAKVYDALTTPSEEDAQFGAFAREAVASLRDLHAMAREAADRLAEMRQNLEVERRSLESVSGRRARLAETVLFETPGSRVDSFARAHRAKIEGRLRSFGYEGDLIAVWKELVHETAERNPLEKAGFCLQSIWGYAGQGRLLFCALIFALIAWGLAAAAATRAGWIGWLRSGSAPFSGFGAWLDSHAGLFGTLWSAAVLIVVLCLVVDVARAARFLNSIFRGATLLKSDLDARRRDVDALLAHQTRRVDMMGREVEAQARRAEEAERRAEGPRASVSRSEELRAFYGDDQNDPKSRARFARDFMDALERVMARASERAPRVLVVLDGFERLAPEAAARFMTAAARLLGRRGFASVYAVDDARIAKAAASDAGESWTRVFQIPLRMRTPRTADAEATISSPAEGFDEPLSAGELAMLSALASEAGVAPRTMKRFANLYRIGRAASGAQTADQGALAVAILEATGAFASDASRRETALDLLTKAGFPVRPEALARFAPLAARFQTSGV